MNLNEADEGLKLKRERGAVRESIASQRGEIRAQQNIIDPERVNMGEERKHLRLRMKSYRG